MNLTKEEISAIADRLDEVIGIYFNDAMYNVIREREDAEWEVSDEDILAIKEQLKRIL